VPLVRLRLVLEPIEQLAGGRGRAVGRKVNMAQSRRRRQVGAVAVLRVACVANRVDEPVAVDDGRGRRARRRVGHTPLDVCRMGERGARLKVEREDAARDAFVRRDLRRRPPARARLDDLIVSVEEDDVVGRAHVHRLVGKVAGGDDEPPVGQEARAQCEQRVDGDERVGGQVVLLAELQVARRDGGVVLGGEVAQALERAVVALGLRTERVERERARLDGARGTATAVLPAAAGDALDPNRGFGEGAPQRWQVGDGRRRAPPGALAVDLGLVVRNLLEPILAVPAVLHVHRQWARVQHRRGQHDAVRLALEVLLLLGWEQHEHGGVASWQLGEREGDVVVPDPVKDWAEGCLSPAAGGREDVRPAQHVPGGDGALADAELAHLGTVLASQPLDGRFRRLTAGRATSTGGGGGACTHWSRRRRAPGRACDGGGGGGWGSLEVLLPVGRKEARPFQCAAGGDGAQRALELAHLGTKLRAHPLCARQGHRGGRMCGASSSIALLTSQAFDNRIGRVDHRMFHSTHDLLHFRFL